MVARGPQIHGFGMQEMPEEIEVSSASSSIKRAWPITWILSKTFRKSSRSVAGACPVFREMECVNTGDEDSPEAGVRFDLIGAGGGLLLTSSGRNVASLRPGETDENTVGVGAVGSGSLTVTINGVSAEIPITVS